QRQWFGSCDPAMPEEIVAAGRPTVGGFFRRARSRPWTQGRGQGRGSRLELESPHVSTGTHRRGVVAYACMGRDTDPKGRGSSSISSKGMTPYRAGGGAV